MLAKISTETYTCIATLNLNFISFLKNNITDGMQALWLSRDLPISCVHPLIDRRKLDMGHFLIAHLTNQSKHEGF